MVRPLDKSDTTDRTTDGNTDPFDTHGRNEFSLQSVTKSAGAGPTATVKLQMSNNGSNWHDVVTHNHTANESKMTAASGVNAKYVRVAWSGFNNLTVDSWNLYATGNPGTA